MVLLAFENVTGDAAFDEIVPLAMSIELEQSPYLRLLSGDHIQETLRVMQRPPASTEGRLPALHAVVGQRVLADNATPVLTITSASVAR